jgi:hypothetical protein
MAVSLSIKNLKSNVGGVMCELDFWSFLAGFGLCLLMTCIVLGVVVKDVYYKLEMYRDQIERLYSVTHSSYYQDVLNGLETISYCAGQYKRCPL